MTQLSISPSGQDIDLTSCPVSGLIQKIYIDEERPHHAVPKSDMHTDSDGTFYYHPTNPGSFVEMRRRAEAYLTSQVKNLHAASQFKLSPDGETVEITYHTHPENGGSILQTHTTTISTHLLDDVPVLPNQIRTPILDHSESGEYTRQTNETIKLELALLEKVRAALLAKLNAIKREEGLQFSASLAFIRTERVISADHMFNQQIATFQFVPNQSSEHILSIDAQSLGLDERAKVIPDMNDMLITLPLELIAGDHYSGITKVVASTVNQKAAEAART